MPICMGCSGSSRTDQIRMHRRILRIKKSKDLCSRQTPVSLDSSTKFGLLTGAENIVFARFSTLARTLISRKGSWTARK
jgi:hypothetical protein